MPANFRALYRRINFSNWIISIEPNASPTTAPTMPIDSGATANSGSSAGASSTSLSSRLPAAKAPILGFSESVRLMNLSRSRLR